MSLFVHEKSLFCQNNMLVQKVKKEIKRVFYLYCAFKVLTCKMLPLPVSPCNQGQMFEPVY